ncbi:hypothetical protein EON65_06500 [archaeon]|nr:MAG: hypothetical protein EON65_06500 [archaeon]
MVILIWVGVFAWTLSRHTWTGPTVQLLRGKSARSALANEASGFNKDPREATHLIIVPGHAALRVSMLSTAAYSDESWYLLSYQRNQAFPKIVSSHIKKGIELLDRDMASLLVFSGGQTRKDVGPISEAASYYYLVQYNNWASQTDLTTRIFLEEYARDSLENLMFSICRFREVTGTYPQHITVVGFDFKENRFTTLHRSALAYPAGNFTYVGLGSPSKFNQMNAVTGEQQAISAFQQDPYGCHDPALANKRSIRDPFHRGTPYDVTCPEMLKLLHWCDANVIPQTNVPWGDNSQLAIAESTVGTL